MSRELANILQDLQGAPSEETTSRSTNPSQASQNWGFTIYRTFYGPSSEEQWRTLVGKIQEQVDDEIQLRKGDDDTVAQQLTSRFHLDLRSDEQLYQATDLDQPRNFYNNASGGTPMHHEKLSIFRLFLVADEEVLADAGQRDSWIKCVQADYEPSAYIPKNTRLGTGQRYFGWMKMTTRSMLELWMELKHQELSQIAPQTIGGMQLVTWDGNE